MRLSDIKNVLTFAAFRPEPDDSAAVWTKRFPRERTLLLNIGRNQTSWRGLSKGGKLIEGGTHRGEFKELAGLLAEEWKSLTDRGWCAISINSRYVISLETNLSRKRGAEELIRTNPRAALGAKFERGKRYALTHNPESIASILLACDEEMIRRIESILRDIGLRAGRICCGTFAMLRRLLEHANNGKVPQKSELRRNYFFVVCCEGAICALIQEGDNWTELRSRTDLYDGTNPAPALDILIPLRERAPHADEPMELLFVSDQEGSTLPEKLAENLSDARVTDLTKTDHIWTTIAEL